MMTGVIGAADDCGCIDSFSADSLYPGLAWKPAAGPAGSWWDNGTKSGEIGAAE